MCVVLFFTLFSKTLGFTGETCEIVRHCKEPQLTPCFNNGTCVLGSDNYEYCKF